MKSSARLATLSLVAAACGAAAFAQTTGTIVGTVVDETEQALPGVSVETTSPSLQGATTAVTDEGGRFALPFLPPGSYLVRFVLSGFGTVEQPDTVVGLGRTVTMAVKLPSSFSEEVTITGERPVVDVSTPEVGVNIPSSFFLSLPIDRNYASAVQAAPGTSTDGAGTVVYGSSGAENAYVIDGVNTTGVAYGTQGKELNFDFIEELQVKTGGYAAEYGRSTGGVINVITKSGGNEFHGDAFGYYFDDSLQSTPTDEVKDYREQYSGTYYVSGFRKADLGADLGGPIVKDKLWFFAAYNRVNNRADDTVAKDFSGYGGPPKGKVYVSDTTRDLWSAKLTWRLGQSHSLIASAFGDPSTQDGPIERLGLNGEESTFMGTVTGGGNDAVVKYEGVLGTHMFLDAHLAHHAESMVMSGPGAGIPKVTNLTTPQYVETRVPYRSGGFGTYREEWFRRDAARVGATLLLDGPGGSHELKGGAEVERLPIDVRVYSSGGQTYSVRCAAGKLTPAGCAPEWTYYTHSVLLSSYPPGGLFDPNLADYITTYAQDDSRWTNAAAYLQDAWRPVPSLTVNLGVRWEGQRMYDNQGRLPLEIWDEWSPRLGFVWDPRGDRSSKLYGSWGRHFETVPLTLTREFWEQTIAGLVNTASDGLFCDPTLYADKRYVKCNIYPVAAEPVDPAGVRGQYVEEAVLGVDLQVSPNLVLGVRAIRRDLHDVIEDSLTPHGYIIGNPGRGQLATILDESGTWPFAAPPPKRRFVGLELTAQKRFADHWQLIGSYLWSRLEGNYDGMYQASTGQLMPNVASAYDYAEFQINNDGYLFNDRRHQAKVAASYTFPFGLDVGGAAFYRSGVPVTAMGWNNRYGTAEYYLSRRGEWDRTDSEFEGSLHLGYPIRLGGMSINILADVFNVLDRQGETSRDQRYTVYQALDVIDYDTGQALPAIANGTPCTDLVPAAMAVYCNPGFNKASAWQSPRSVRIGVRLTF